MSIQTDHPCIKKWLPTMVFLLCVIQPLMDVASFFLVRQELSTWPTMLLRTTVLLFTVLCGFLITRRRGIYISVFLVLGGFTLLHCLACIQVGYSQIVEDLGNLLRIFSFPLTALVFLTFLRADRQVYPAVCRGLGWSFGLIVWIVLLSVVTGTDPHTYDSGNGICGWFFSGNSQSAILSMLSPIVIWQGIQKSERRLLPVLLLAGASFALLFLLGTRLAYAAIAAIGICFFLGLLLLDHRRYARQGCVVLATAILFLAAYPLSPMVSQQARHAGIVQERQAILEELYAQNLDAQGEDAAYQAVYEEFAPELIHRFGTATIRRAYQDSLDYATLSGVRQQKLLFGNLLMAQSPLMTRLFGLELSQFTFQGANFDVENDLHGIYFLCGWVGLALMLL